ncbi:MAG: O-antigen ligase family protein [Acidimicrobiales bacterium]
MELNGRACSPRKCSFGFTAAITLPSMFILDRGALRWRWLARLNIMIFVPLLIGSQSKTMFVATGLSIGLLFFYKAFRARKTMRGAVLVALLSSTVFSVFSQRPTWRSSRTLLEKDVTLTGRTVLWASLIDPIKRSFFIGYGYNVAFTDPFGPLFEVFLDNTWGVSHAYNSLFQIMLDAGALGLSLYLWAFFRAVGRATEVTRRVPGMLGLWPLTFLTTVLLISISEPGVTGGGFGWLLLVLAMLYARHGRSLPLIAEQEEAASPAAGGAGEGTAGFLGRRPLVAHSRC